MEPPVQQSHPHPKASNSVTEATADSGSPSPKPLQKNPHEAAARTHHHVAHNNGASSVDHHRFSDEEEELNNFNNNQKKQQDAFLSSFPAGYRFNPRDEELVRYYLQKKIMDEPLPPNKIMEVNLYRYNPETLAGKYDTYGEKEWYFFTPRDRKYRNGQRPNRAAGDGYWKATGADKSIKSGNIEVGFRKALVFYRGKPPKGKKTNWIMHEYRVPDSRTAKRTGNDMRLDNWVLCRIYKKANNKNKIQTRNHAVDPGEEHISMSITDDTEMEMNGQVDDTQTTESEEEYTHTIAHPPLEFDGAYPTFAYHYTSYPGVAALDNNMLQPVVMSYKDGYANIFPSLQTSGSSSALQCLDQNGKVPISHHKLHPVDITSKSIVCKEEASDQMYGVQFPNQKFMQSIEGITSNSTVCTDEACSDQQYGMQFPSQEYIVHSLDGRAQTKTHSCGKSVRPGDAVDFGPPSVPYLDQTSIQQKIGKPLLLPSSDGLQYIIEESNDEHDNLFFDCPHFTYSEPFPWP
ncbi:PREDICTED: uncharacterized protein LOC101294338 [Fragaria vesca subsp. vesca]